MYQIIDTNKPDLKINVTPSAVDEISKSISPEFEAEKVISAISREITNVYMFDMFNVKNLETIELKYPSNPQGYRTILKLNFSKGETMNGKPFHAKNLYTVPKHTILKVSNEVKDNEMVLTITV